MAPTSSPSASAFGNQLVRFRGRLFPITDNLVHSRPNAIRRCQDLHCKQDRNFTLQNEIDRSCSIIFLTPCMGQLNTRAWGNGEPCNMSWNVVKEEAHSLYILAEENAIRCILDLPVTIPRWDQAALALPLRNTCLIAQMCPAGQLCNSLRVAQPRLWWIRKL